MRRAIIPIAALIALGEAFAAPAASEDLVFDVYRNDGEEPFGRHVIRFDELEDGGLEVRTDVELKVKLGFIPVFKYRHEAREIWRDGRLVAVEARTNDDGDKRDVELRCTDFCVQTAPQETRFDAPIWPASHWNRAALEKGALYNTTKGGLMDVTVTRLGADGFEQAGRSVEGEGYRIEGSVPYELYFDGERLVGARFYLRGNTLSYVPARDTVEKS